MQMAHIIKILVAFCMVWHKYISAVQVDVDGCFRLSIILIYLVRIVFNNQK